MNLISVNDLICNHWYLLTCEYNELSYKLMLYNGCTSTGCGNIYNFRYYPRVKKRIKYKNQYYLKLGKQMKYNFIDYNFIQLLDHSWFIFHSLSDNDDNLCNHKMSVLNFHPNIINQVNRIKRWFRKCKKQQMIKLLQNYIDNNLANIISNYI